MNKITHRLLSGASFAALSLMAPDAQAANITVNAGNSPHAPINNTGALDFIHILSHGVVGNGTAHSGNVRNDGAVGKSGDIGAIEVTGTGIVYGNLSNYASGTKIGDLKGTMYGIAELGGLVTGSLINHAKITVQNKVDAGKTIAGIAEIGGVLGGDIFDNGKIKVTGTAKGVGHAYGIFVDPASVNTTINHPAGTMTVHQKATGVATARAIAGGIAVTATTHVHGVITNDGIIKLKATASKATSAFATAVGIKEFAHAGSARATITNDGKINAVAIAHDTKHEAAANAFGILVSGTTVVAHIHNSAGLIKNLATVTGAAHGYARASGIAVEGDFGAAHITNKATINVHASANKIGVGTAAAAGIYVDIDSGIATVHNVGKMTVGATDHGGGKIAVGQGSGIGLFGNVLNGDITNKGHIYVLAVGHSAATTNSGLGADLMVGDRTLAAAIGRSGAPGIGHVTAHIDNSAALTVIGEGFDGKHAHAFAADIFALAHTITATINNTAGIKASARAQSAANTDQATAAGIAVFGTSIAKAKISNSGAINVTAHANLGANLHALASGLAVLGAGQVTATIHNHGNLDVQAEAATGNSAHASAYGIDVSGATVKALIHNTSGTITVRANVNPTPAAHARATGIYVAGAHGSAKVTNAATLDVVATAHDAIAATAEAAAIHLALQSGTATVHNSAGIKVTAHIHSATDKALAIASGIAIDGQTSIKGKITNTASVAVHANASAGITKATAIAAGLVVADQTLNKALGTAGKLGAGNVSAHIVNTSKLSVGAVAHSAKSVNAVAAGMFVSGKTVAADIVNSGGLTVDASAYGAAKVAYAAAVGINVQGKNGLGVAITNTATIHAVAKAYDASTGTAGAAGIIVDPSGNVTIHNHGKMTITAKATDVHHAHASAFGISAQALHGISDNVTLTNDANIGVKARATGTKDAHAVASGIYAAAGEVSGNAAIHITNAGTFNVKASAGGAGLATAHAYGIEAEAVFALDTKTLGTLNAIIHNDGSVKASAVATYSVADKTIKTAHAHATGLLGIAGAGFGNANVTIHNSNDGHVTAQALASGGGALAIAHGVVGFASSVFDGNVGVHITNDAGGFITVAAGAFSGTTVKAHAVGIQGTAHAATPSGAAGGSGNALVKIVNSGTVGPYAFGGKRCNYRSGSLCSGGDPVKATVTATGMLGVADFAKNATAEVTNNGHVFATAIASATSQARAHAIGIGAYAHDATSTAKVTVIGTGNLTAKAIAHGSADADSHANATATGIHAQASAAKNAAVHVTNGGALHASAYADAGSTATAQAYGIRATALEAAGNAKVTVTNQASGAIRVTASADASDHAKAYATGIYANAAGAIGSANALVNNHGDITVFAYASSSLRAAEPGSAVAWAKGIVAVAKSGNGTADNAMATVHNASGAIKANAFANGSDYASARASGINVAAGGVPGNAIANVTNSAGIHAKAEGLGSGIVYANAIGIAAAAEGAGGNATAHIVNNGANVFVSASADAATGTAKATGMKAFAASGKNVAATITNHGSVTAIALASASEKATAAAMGLVAVAIEGNHSAAAKVSNTGHVSAKAVATVYAATHTAKAYATGIYASAQNGGTGNVNAKVSNAGSITAHARVSAAGLGDVGKAYADGIVAQAVNGGKSAQVHVTNNADINVTATAIAQKTATAFAVGIDGLAMGAKSGAGVHITNLGGDVDVVAYANAGLNADAAATGILGIAANHVTGNAAVVVNNHGGANARANVGSETAPGNGAAFGVGIAAIATDAKGSLTVTVHDYKGASAVGTGYVSASTAFAQGLGIYAVAMHAGGSAKINVTNDTGANISAYATAIVVGGEGKMATAQAVGIRAMAGSADGNALAHVHNAGTINVGALADPAQTAVATAIGVSAMAVHAQNVTATASNTGKMIIAAKASGTAKATAKAYGALAVATSAVGNAEARAYNQGTLSVLGSAIVTGIPKTAAYALAAGVEAIAQSAETGFALAKATNAGKATVKAFASAADEEGGIVATASAFGARATAIGALEKSAKASATNSGHLKVTASAIGYESAHAHATGVLADALFAKSALAHAVNDGSLSVYAYANGPAEVGASRAYASAYGAKAFAGQGIAKAVATASQGAEGSMKVLALAIGTATTYAQAKAGGVVALATNASNVKNAVTGRANVTARAFNHGHINVTASATGGGGAHATAAGVSAVASQAEVHAAATASNHKGAMTVIAKAYGSDSASAHAYGVFAEALLVGNGVKALAFNQGTAKLSAIASVNGVGGEGNAAFAKVVGVEAIAMLGGEGAASAKATNTGKVTAYANAIATNVSGQATATAIGARALAGEADGNAKASATNTGSVKITARATGYELAQAKATGVSAEAFDGENAMAHAVNNGALSVAAYAQGGEGGVTKAEASAVGLRASAVSAPVSALATVSQDAKGSMKVHAVASASTSAKAVAVGISGYAWNYGEEAAVHAYNHGHVSVKASAIATTKAYATATGMRAVASAALDTVVAKASNTAKGVIDVGAMATARGGEEQETALASANAKGIFVHAKSGQDSQADATAVNAGHVTVQAFASAGIHAVAKATGIEALAEHASLLRDVVTNAGVVLVSAIADANRSEDAALASAHAIGMNVLADAGDVGHLYVSNKTGHLDVYAHASAATSAEGETAAATGIHVAATHLHKAFIDVMDHKGSITASAYATNLAGYEIAVPDAHAVANGIAALASKSIANSASIAIGAEGKINVKAWATATHKATATAEGIVGHAIAVATNATVKITNEAAMNVVGFASVGQGEIDFAEVGCGNGCGNGIGSGNATQALAFAEGIDAVADPFGAAKATVKNFGALSVLASAIASGEFVIAQAKAIGIGAVAANGQIGDTVHITNDAQINVTAHATAGSAFIASAIATATGIHSLARHAVGGEGKHNVTVDVSNEALGAMAVKATARVTSAELAHAKALAHGIAATAMSANHSALANVHNSAMLQVGALAVISNDIDPGATATATGILAKAIHASNKVAATATQGGHGAVSVAASALNNFGSAVAVAEGIAAVADDVEVGSALAKASNKGYVSAHAKAYGEVSAHANASGVLAVASDAATAKASAINHATLNAVASADASDEVGAIAYGVDAIALSAGSVHASAFNDGAVSVKAIATDNFALADYANAYAVGVSALAYSGGQVTAVAKNNGPVKALASASGFLHAQATVIGVDAYAHNSRGEDQVGSVNAEEEAGPVVRATASNFHKVTGTAHAYANDTAYARAAGVVAYASVASGSIAAKAVNGGTVKLSAYAHSFGNGSGNGAGNGSAVATGVLAVARSATGPASAQASNTGTVHVNAHADNNNNAVANAAGVAAAAGSAENGYAHVFNSGNVFVSAKATAAGAEGHAIASAFGLYASASEVANGTAEVVNSGKVTAKAVIAGHGTALAEGVLAGVFSAETDNLNVYNNGGNVMAVASAPNGLAHAIGVDVQANHFTGEVFNSGKISAYAKGGAESATGIRVARTSREEQSVKSDAVGAEGAGLIVNNGGTIWAGVAVGDGSDTKRGNAIDVSNAPDRVVIDLQGEFQQGYIYGNIKMAASDTVNVYDGHTLFDGIINPDATPESYGGALNIGTGNGTHAGVLEMALNEAEGNAQAYVDTYHQYGNGTLALDVTPNPDPSFVYIHANNATLGGVVELNLSPGTYLSNTVYRVVIDDGADATDINGHWDVVQVDGSNASNTLFLTAKEQDVLDGTVVTSGPFDEADVVLNRIAFNDTTAVPSLLTNPNEFAVATALEDSYPSATGAYANMLNALATFSGTEEQYQQLLDLLSGEEYGQTALAQLNVADILKDAIAAHLQAILGGPGETASLATGITPASGGTMGGARVWGGAFGTWGTTDTTIAGSGFNQSDTGLTAGGDVPLSPSTTLGLAGAWTAHGSLSFDDGDSARYSGFEGGVYGRYNGGDAFYLQGLASYGTYTNNVVRHVTIPGFGAATERGNFDSHVWQFYGEGGWHVLPNPDVDFIPYAAFDYLHAVDNEFTEHGTGGTMLNVSGVEASSASSYVGLKAALIDGGVTSIGLIPTLTLAWQHDFSSNMWTVNTAFAGVPTSAFTITGNGLAKDSLIAGAEIAVNFSSDVDAVLDYQGRFNTDHQDGSILGRVNFHF